MSYQNCVQRKIDLKQLCKYSPNNVPMRKVLCMVPSLIQLFLIIFLTFFSYNKKNTTF
jgi:hypothetical protein